MTVGLRWLRASIALVAGAPLGPVALINVHL
jgi:hypothetical protein